MYPEQSEDQVDEWSTHYASQSPQQLSQGQINVMVMITLFTTYTFREMFAVGGESEIVKLLMPSFTLFMVVTWGILLSKVRECAVWPEEVIFRSDGLIFAELGCGHRVLNSSEGVTLLKKRTTLTNFNLGVWANAVTDRRRDYVFVLIPTHGPKFWTGFAFQPEDPRSFIHDCHHAGVDVSQVGDIEEMDLEERLLHETERRNSYPLSVRRNFAFDTRDSRSNSLESEQSVHSADFLNSACSDCSDNNSTGSGECNEEEGAAEKPSTSMLRNNTFIEV
mmetsp:Transcript_14454/g.26821  ORF Transcript_14454/g.26821 Transcript_14454/m.26821 type:complete len:278 (-) Transcript_14454:36-869(-)